MSEYLQSFSSLFLTKIDVTYMHLTRSHDSENVLLKTTKKTCFTITIKQTDRVVIYHVHNHLCSRIISVDGTIWYNDNITTSNNSIQDGHLSTMNYEELKTCNEKDLYLLYMYNLLLRKK